MSGDLFGWWRGRRILGDERKWMDGELIYVSLMHCYRRGSDNNDENGCCDADLIR